MRPNSKSLKRALSKLSTLKTEKRRYLENKMYQTQYSVLGCSVPVQRNFLKNQKFSNVDQKSIQYWAEIWRESSCFEVMNLSLFYFQGIRDIDFLITNKKIILGLNTKVDNWAHSDVLSCVLARMREKSPGDIDPVLRKWNVSKKFWQQRLSLTSLFYYSNLRKRQAPFLLAKSFINAHLLSSDYYVQKAVGWTLREMGNVYPEKTYEFLDKNILKLSSYAFSAATEKMSVARKKKLKLCRKKRKAL